MGWGLPPNTERITAAQHAATMMSKGHSGHFVSLHRKYKSVLTSNMILLRRVNIKPVYDVSDF